MPSAPPAGPSDTRNDPLGLIGAVVEQVRFDACVDAGGFGLIYRGYHLGLGEDVAIKVLRIATLAKGDDAIREQLVGRFRDETKLLYRLSQGNLDIVRCLGSGAVTSPVTRELTPYMVLEWLDGCTLSTELKERRLQNLGVRSLETTIGLLDSAAGAIAYAHAHDVVHRDIKPGNLFITRTREGVRVKVLDFGLAKILSDDSIGIRPSVETAAGVHFCSPSYGAPEQFRSSVGKIGPWTDVYSFALVLLECMVGDKVRRANNLPEGLMRAIDPVTGSPSPSSLGLRVAPAVEELMKRAVAQNPMDRPRDLGLFWAQLKEAVASAPKPNAAATVADDRLVEAMQQVREDVIRASQKPPPFAGTMLMHNAPIGAPHLAPAPVPDIAPIPNRPPAPRPAAGMPADAAFLASAPQGTTAPLQAPISPKTPPRHMDMTMPLGAVNPMSLGLPPSATATATATAGPSGSSPPIAAQSPLASSMTAGTSPVANLPVPPPAIPTPMQVSVQAVPHAPHPQHPPQPHAGAPPPQPGAQQGASGPPPNTNPGVPSAHPPAAHDDPRRTDPRATFKKPKDDAAVPMSSNIGIIIAGILAVMILIAGVTLYVVRVRGH